MLARVGIEAAEDVGCGVFFQFDGGHQSQEVIPVFQNHRFIDCFIWRDSPGFSVLVSGLERIERLLSNPFDPWGKRKPQHVGQAKDGFCVTVGIGGMDITFDNVIVHQPVDYIGTFAVGRTDHQRMPEEVAFIDKGRHQLKNQHSAVLKHGRQRRHPVHENRMVGKTALRL